MVPLCRRPTRHTCQTSDIVSKTPQWIRSLTSRDPLYVLAVPSPLNPLFAERDSHFGLPALSGRHCGTGASTGSAVVVRSGTIDFIDFGLNHALKLGRSGRNARQRDAEHISRAWLDVA